MRGRGRGLHPQGWLALVRRISQECVGRRAGVSLPAAPHSLPRRRRRECPAWEEQRRNNRQYGVGERPAPVHVGHAGHVHAAGCVSRLGSRGRPARGPPGRRPFLDHDPEIFAGDDRRAGSGRTRLRPADHQGRTRWPAHPPAQRSCGQCRRGRARRLRPNSAVSELSADQRLGSGSGPAQRGRPRPPGRRTARHYSAQPQTRVSDAAGD